MLNKSFENFTWAQNGAGAHSMLAAKSVADRLYAAYKEGGSDAVSTTLDLLKSEMSTGKFF